MSVRLSMLALTSIAYLIILLSNLAKVDVQVFWGNWRLSLASVIATSTLFGIGVSFIFMSLGSSQKKLKKRLRSYELNMFRKNESTNKKETQKQS